MKRRYRIKQEDASTSRLATVWVEDDGLDAPLLRDERPSRVVVVVVVLMVVVFIGYHY